MPTTESYGETMKNELYRRCAFTGHRPAKFPWKYDENDPRCVELKAVLARQIEKLAAAGMTDFFTGMALGVDTWAAMAVLDLRKRIPAIKLHCVLPCEGQETKWSTPAQILYRGILSDADSVEYVKRTHNRKCMLERNQRLIDSTGVLLEVITERSGAGRLLPSVTLKRRAGRLS